MANNKEESIEDRTPQRLVSEEAAGVTEKKAKNYTYIDGQ